MNTSPFTKLHKRYLHITYPIILGLLLLAALLWAMGEVSPARAFSVNEPISSTTTTLANTNVLTIGVASTLSVAGDLGWRQANAVQLAVDQINASGGLNIGGTIYTITLASADSACSPTQAITAANQLLNAGAVAVVGHSCSGATDAAQAVYAAAGVSMISPSSTSPQITEQGYSTTFRVISRDDSPPVLLATYLRDRLTLERAAIVEIDGFWGNVAGDVFSTTFTSLGGTITSRNTVTSTTAFTGALTTIMAENPHTIHIADDLADTAGFLSKTAHNLGMTEVVIGWTTYSAFPDILNDYVATAGDAAEGDIAAMSHRNQDDMTGYPAFNADYMAAGFFNYGDEATLWGAFAHDAAQIIIAAMKRAGSTNPAEIRAEIAATKDYHGVVGTYAGFDAKGDVIPQWAWLEQYQDGQWVRVGDYKVLLPMAVKLSGQ